MPFVGQFAMDLVRNHEYPVPQADVADTPQLFRRPDPSDRVMRVAQQQQLRFRIGGFRFEIVEIDRIAVVPVNEAIGRHFASVVADRRVETVVGRGLDDHPVARNRQGFDDRRQRRNDAARIDDPPGIHLPAVTVLEPPHDGIVIGLRHFGIAENPVRHAPLQGFDNGWSGTEVHVRHPHGQYAFFFGGIPFVGVRPATRDNCVEIVFHNLFFYP